MHLVFVMLAAAQRTWLPVSSSTWPLGSRMALPMLRRIGMSSMVQAHGDVPATAGAGGGHVRSKRRRNDLSRPGVGAAHQSAVQKQCPTVSSAPQEGSGTQGLQRQQHSPQVTRVAGLPGYGNVLLRDS